MNIRVDLSRDQQVLRPNTAACLYVRDPSWDVNDFLQGLREKVKSWKEVYWRCVVYLFKQILSF